MKSILDWYKIYGNLLTVFVLVGVTFSIVFEYDLWIKIVLLIVAVFNVIVSFMSGNDTEEDLETIGYKDKDKE